MTESDIRRLMVALARIEVSVEALREENSLAETRGQTAHNDYETRIRSLEQFRWRIAGAWAVLGLVIGSGGGAAVTILIR